MYIYSPSLYQDLFQKTIKCFSIYIPNNKTPNNLKDKDFVSVSDEILDKQDFDKSDTEMEKNESIEELKFPQEYEDGGLIISDDSNEKEMNEPRVQAMFERSRHNISSTFIISQDYSEKPERTFRANGNIYHIFKPNNFRNVQNLFQDKASMDMNLNEFKLLTNTCWNKKYQL